MKINDTVRFLRIFWLRYSKVSVLSVSDFPYLILKNTDKNQIEYNFFICKKSDYDLATYQFIY